MLVTLIMVVSSKISFGASSSNLCNGTLVTYTVQELVYHRTFYKGWCPCKEQECRAYRRAKGIPAWNGHFLESPNNTSTTAVHSSVRPPPPTRYRETSV